jgi:hypothetical protein
LEADNNINQAPAIVYNIPTSCDKKIFKLIGHAQGSSHVFLPLEGDQLTNCDASLPRKKGYSYIKVVEAELNLFLKKRIIYVDALSLMIKNFHISQNSLEYLTQMDIFLKTMNDKIFYDCQELRASLKTMSETELPRIETLNRYSQIAIEELGVLFHSIDYQMRESFKQDDIIITDEGSKWIFNMPGQDARVINMLSKNSFALEEGRARIKEAHEVFRKIV